MTVLLSVNNPGQGVTAEGQGLFGKGQRAASAKEAILSLILRCHYLPAFHVVTRTVQSLHFAKTVLSTIMRTIGLVFFFTLEENLLVQAGGHDF